MAKYPAMGEKSNEQWLNTQRWLNNIAWAMDEDQPLGKYLGKLGFWALVN